MATILLDTSVIFDHLNGRYGRTKSLEPSPMAIRWCDVSIETGRLGS
jgi:hypothetical protein